jgi:ABC-type proline/glycine betaine transport system permease subunit
MEFNVNHPILFVFVGLIIAAVIGQSVYFLVKSYRRAKEIGMDMTKINKTIKTAAIFTIAPAISIVITVVALSKSLGIALPWLRLSVVGSLSYEAIAAANAASGMGTTLAELAKEMTASQFVTIASVMTISIMVGIWLVPVVAKKYQAGMVSFEKKDQKWSDILQNSLFIGMISAFVGYVFCDISRLWRSVDGIFTVVKKSDGAEVITKYTSTSGLVPVCVMATSALLMCICGLLINKLKMKWLNDYALPICMVVGMAVAIPLTNILGGVIA